MTCGDTQFHSHPDIASIYEDMMTEASSPVSVPREHVNTVTVSTNLYDGVKVSPSSSDGGSKKTFTITTKTFDGASEPPKKEKKSFSRKNSTDSASAFCIADEQQQKKPSKGVNRNFSRKNSSDSAFSLYNDDDMWALRIGEIMNRPPPVDNVRVTTSPATSSSQIRRRQSSENTWVKRQQFGGSISRRNSTDGAGNTNNSYNFARKNSRSTSPKFIPPIDPFNSPIVVADAVAAMKPKVGLPRRNSITRSRSPKFIAPLTSSDHDESRVFKGTLRRHSVEAPNPFTSYQLQRIREERAARRSSDEGSSTDDDVVEQVKYCLKDTLTPKVEVKDERGAIPRKPFSRHNSVEGVDLSIFPSLPILNKSLDFEGSDESDPNNDLAMLFEHLIDQAEDDSLLGDEEEDDGCDNIIKRHQKIRRRCSTGGLRTFDRENFRNFLEDTEGEDSQPVESASRRGSLFRKCSTGGLRTLQRESSRELYSDDCSLDGQRMPLSIDTAFEDYLQKLRQEADVDTSNDAKVIDEHVVASGAVRSSIRSSIRSVGSFVDASEDPLDFAEFISRVGVGLSSSQTVSTVANTSYTEDSHGNPGIEDFKEELPHRIHMPNALDESVSSLDDSNRHESINISKLPFKDLGEVHFTSSKSRSIKRLCSKDGIKELQELAEGVPDLGNVALKDLPGLIKDIDRDLVTERAVYRKRQSSGSESILEESARLEEREKMGVGVQFNSTQTRKQLEPTGRSARYMTDSDLAKPRKQKEIHCMGHSFISTEPVSNYIRKGYVDQHKGEIPPLSVIVVEKPDGASVEDEAEYKPKRRRSSTKSSEDRKRFGKQGRSFEGRRKELAKNSPFRNHDGGSSSLREGIDAIKSLRRKLSSSSLFIS